MVGQVLTTLLTVVAGIGAALVVYWILNKLAELLPGRWEDRVKPYLYIAPGVRRDRVYLVYPAVLTIINSFKTDVSRRSSASELHRPARHDRPSSRRCSTPCSGSSSCRRDGPARPARRGR